LMFYEGGCSMKGDVKRKRFSSEPDQAQLAWHPAPPSLVG
jgi:hypothetical protein